MAKIHKNAVGFTGKRGSVEAVVARHVTVQKRLDDLALEYGLRAEAILLAHKHDGHSTIRVESGRRTDRYVILDDDRGLRAAMSIEYGRHREFDSHGNPQSTSRGVWALHDAFGLPHGE